MGDKRVLRMSWRYNERLDVEVVDTDRCLVLDLYVDLLEGAKKEMMRLPKDPTLHYAYEGRSHQLLSDADVMKMFASLKDNQLIHLDIGSTETPCLPLQLARGLIESKKTSLNSSVSQPTSDVVILPPFPLPIVQELIPFYDLVRPQPSVQPIPSQRKMPATTAKRRGIYVPRKSKSHSTPNQPTHGRCSRTRSINQSMDVSFEVEFADDISIEDEDYEPSGSTDDVHSESTDDVHSDIFSMEEDMGEDNITLLEVNDGYEPYTGDAWDVDKEAYFDRLYDNGELYSDKEFGNIKLQEWMIFTDKNHFKDALIDYCIQEGFSIMVIHSDKKRYSADCSAADCEWHIHASRLSDGITWAIKSLKNDHSCNRLEEHNPMATASWAAKKVIEDVRVKPNIPGKDLNDILFETYGVTLKKSSLYKTREYALIEIQGGHDTSYGKLPTYCEVVKMTNPGSKAHCSWKVAQDLPEKPIQFNDIFISFRPQVLGYIHGCRGLIGVDGTHLKGNHGGVLLSAIGLDGNNELFPLAYGVYDNESKRTWSSFFCHLKDCLKDSHRDDWTIISDRQKGVEPALQDVWPSVSRRFCCRHLCNNFKKSYPGPLMHRLFWRVCNAYSEHTFNKAIERLQKEAGFGAVKWFGDLGDKECWTRHKFNPSLCSDENKSNFVESFNATLGVNRCNPVLTLLEGIRRVCMVRHATRQQKAESWDANGITPNVAKLLKVHIKDSRTCKAHMASPREFEVQDGYSYLPVSLTARTCACGQWQISGIPCKHAVKAIIRSGGSPHAYVSPCYSVRTYKQAYALNFNPIPDAEQWPTFDLPQIQPPTMKRSIGRPCRNRRREDGEKRKGKRSRTVQCRNCKAFGHNTRTCKGGPTAREVREQRGMNVQQHRRGKGQKNPGHDAEDLQDFTSSQYSSLNVGEMASAS